jgi:sulfonate transport system substrate-binding protein
VNAYEKARAWALENPEETAAILAEVAGIDIAIATAVIADRTNLGVDPVPGQAQVDVLTVIGPIFVESGDVASQDLIDDALASLLEPKFAEAADPSAL